MAAYEVWLTSDGRSLQRIESAASGEKRGETEPGTGWLLRAGVNVMSILPTEWSP